MSDLIVVKDFRRNPEPAKPARARRKVLKAASLSVALLALFALGAGSLSRGPLPPTEVETVAQFVRASDRIPAPLGRTERITAAPAVIVRSQSFEEQRISVEAVEEVEVTRPATAPIAETTSTTAAPIEVPAVIGLPVDAALTILAAAGVEVQVLLQATEDTHWGIVLALSDGVLTVGSE